MIKLSEVVENLNFGEYVTVDMQDMIVGRLKDLEAAAGDTPEPVITRWFDTWIVYRKDEPAVAAFRYSESAAVAFANDKIKQGDKATYLVARIAFREDGLCVADLESAVLDNSRGDTPPELPPHDWAIYWPRGKGNVNRWLAKNGAWVSVANGYDTMRFDSREECQAEIERRQLVGFPFPVPKLFPSE